MKRVEGSLRNQWKAESERGGRMFVKFPTCSMVWSRLHELMHETKMEIKNKLPKIYSKNLVEVLFFHPYTKISSIQEYLKVTRKTASNYLKELETIGLLSVEKRDREAFYVNTKLYELFRNRSSLHIKKKHG